MSHKNSNAQPFPVPCLLSPVPCSLSPVPCPLSPSRRAFTLVEMLVAMALTLILVYSIAHFYAIVGDAVKDGRAMIEMNQQLRAVVERLKSDLDQVTVPITPWADEGGAAGYFEYREGQASDWDVNGNYRLDANYDIPNRTNIWPPTIATPPGPDAVPDFDDPLYTSALGDTDDIFALTIRAGNVPFSGQMLLINPGTGLLALASQPPDKVANPPKSVATTAPYAEVVWWTSFTDTNLNATWDLGEPRSIHRRQLLIRPDLNVSRGASDFNNIPYYVKIPVPSPLTNPLAIWVYDLFQYCDISMRPAAINNGFVYFIANSLQDLCLRENRFMHTWRFFESTPGQLFPYPIDLNPNWTGNFEPNLVPDNQASLANTQPRHAVANAFTQYRWALCDGGRKGEDIILSNALAFDVRLFDPDAIVRGVRTDAPPPTSPASQSPGDQNLFSFVPVQPGDAGYAYAVANYYQGTNSNNSHNPYPALGTGAYVDLGYGVALANALPWLDAGHNVVNTARALQLLMPPTVPAVSAYAPVLGSSRFANAPNYFAAIGFTYDTWTLMYERDGINQNGNKDPITNQPLIDEGTDGVDNPIPNPNQPPPTFIYVGGVDDVSERETTPPYASPVRGVQVRVRVYDPHTRQVRQATVESDFIPE